MATNKTRDYFITINQGAESYEDALEIVRSLNFALYAYIVHDSDTNADGTIKKVHKHIMIELKNPITFSSMQKKFPGAHIEIPRYKKNAYQYLLHESPNSLGVKYSYPFENIISNSPEAVKAIIETETSELFIETQYLRYIAEGINTPYRFVQRFGLNAFKQYWNVYSYMLEQSGKDEEMKEQLKKVKSELETSTAIDFLISNSDNPNY